MAQARKYIMECSTIQPSGITTVTLDTVTLSLLNSFSGVRDTSEGGSFSYNPIGLNDLTLLTDIQYNSRVSDFLICIQVPLITRGTT